MKYQFPVITDINQARLAIKDRPEFVEAVRDGYTVFNYNLSKEDSFDCHLRRECRGLIFCNQTGKVLARRLHKFFNMNEREETLQDNIDWDVPHIVLDKLDGSMITPFMLNGEVRWATKMGITDIALDCEKFVRNNPKYHDFARFCILCNVTPIFEYIGPKNRIVIEYDQEDLILLTIRYNKSGEYLKRDYIGGLAFLDNIPVVQKFKGSLDQLKEQTDIEGVIVQFEDGHMVKVKTDWYIAIHKAKENLLFEKNVIKLILEEKLDDIIPDLPKKDVERLNDYKDGLIQSIETLTAECHDLIDWCKQQQYNRKQLAEHVMSVVPEFTRSIIFSCYDDPSKIKDEWIKKILKKTGSQSDVDSIRDYLGVSWNV